MSNLPTQKYLDVPAQMVLEIAYGVEDPQRVAEKFGFSETEWLTLKVHDPFVRQVEGKKAELKASGYSFRMKAAIAAEDVLEDVYAASKQDDASFHTKLEALKFFARAAGLEQPVKAQQETGPAFSITIDLGGGKSMQINANQNQQAESQGAYNTIDADEVSAHSQELDLGEIPSYLRAHDKATALVFEE